VENFVVDKVFLLYNLITEVRPLKSWTRARRGLTSVIKLLKKSMQKTAIIVIVLIVLIAIAIGAYYLLSNKVEEESSVTEGSEESLVPDLGNLAPVAEVGVIENPLEDMPQTNPLDDVPNPFEGGYENPFEE